MKIAKIVLLLGLSLGGLYAFGRFFLSQLGPGQPSELAAVIMAPPPGFRIVEQGELSSAGAAAALELEVLREGNGKVGLHFKRQGAVVYWLADPEADRLEELSAGATGTRLKTVWSGGLRSRLAWARVHGDPAVPGLALPEQTNLYH